jgi:hypothetical protein
MFKKEYMEEGMIIHHIIGWKELKFYNENPPIVSLPKGLTIFNKYNSHMKNINDIFLYLMNKLFLNNDFFVIKNADFPYYVSEYIVHKIIWFNPKYYIDIPIDYDYIKKILKKKKINNYIVFENIQKNKSVKKIKHYHFFILKTNIYDINQ